MVLAIAGVAVIGDALHGPALGPAHEVARGPAAPAALVIAGQGAAGQHAVLVGQARAGAQGRGVLDSGHALNIGGVGLGVETLEGQGEVRRRAPLQRQRHGGALLLPAAVTPAQIFRMIHRRAVQPRDRVEAVRGDAVGAVADTGIADVGQKADLARPGHPAVAEDARPGPVAFLHHVAVVVVGREGQQASGLVERQARAQIDRAADAALDLVGGRVLVDVHARQQVGRDVLERQAPSVAGREDVPAVGFGPDPGQAPDEDPPALCGQTGRVTGFVGALQGDARDALQGLRHRPVRQGADVHGGDRVHDHIGVALDVLGALKTGAKTGDDHFLDFGGLIRLLRRLGQRRGVHGAQSDQGHAQRQGEFRDAFTLRHLVPLPVSNAPRRLWPALGGCSPMCTSAPVSHLTGIFKYAISFYYRVCFVSATNCCW